MYKIPIFTNLFHSFYEVGIVCFAISIACLARIHGCKLFSVDVVVWLFGVALSMCMGELMLAKLDILRQSSVLIHD